MFTIFKDHNYNEPIMVADTFDDVLILYEEKDREWIERYFRIYAAMEVKGMSYRNYWVEWR